MTRSVVQHLAACLLGACLLGAEPAQAALSGNEQVSLAGRGAFEELALGIQAQADAGAGTLKVADWHTLCYAYYRLKRYDRIGPCLDSLEGALKGRDKRTRLFGLENATPTVPLLRAETALELGQFGDAVQLAQRVLDWYRKDGEDERDLLVQALAVQAIALRNLNLRDQADGLLNDLRAVPANMLGDEAIAAKSLALARVCMALGYWADALEALALDKTLPLRKFMDNLATGAFLRNENNWVWIELPRAYMENKALMELGEIARAKSGFEAMLRVPQIAANGEIHWMVLADYGRILEAEKANAEAIAVYQQAMTIIEAQRANVHTEANKIGFIGDKQMVYARLIRLLYSEGRYADALETSERSKSRALVDILASKQRFGNPVGERSQGSSTITQALADMARSDTVQREQSASRVRGLATLTFHADFSPRMPAELRSLVSVKALKPEAIQGLLDSDESLLTYFAYGTQMVAMVVQKNSIVAKLIDATELERDIRSFRAAMIKRLDTTPMLQALYQRLVAPVAGQLTQPRLSIAAHGALHYLPFAALMDGDQYLVDRFTLRMLPSASVLQFLRPKQTVDLKRSLVMGNPDLHNPELDLPGAQAEAVEVAASLGAPGPLLREQASKEAFVKLAPKASVVHVASHGEFNSALPLGSRLLLAGTSDQDTHLTVADLYDLGLDAELVTLSACETGLGAVANGDDVVGLTRGLLYAGASSVVTSLWKVDDESTGELMSQMYQNLRRNQPTDEALRLAQLVTRKHFSHPYYWAAFYLTGMH